MFEDLETGYTWLHEDMIPSMALLSMESVIISMFTALPNLNSLGIVNIVLAECNKCYISEICEICYIWKSPNHTVTPKKSRAIALSMYLWNKVCSYLYIRNGIKSQTLF